MAALLEKQGVACWGTATMMREGRDLVHRDAEVRRETVDYVKKTVTLASSLGGEIVTITPAVGKLEPTARTADEWRWAVDGLREVHEHAAELGIRVGFEPLNRYETHFVNRCEQALALADDVGPGFGVVLDVFHMNIEESDWAAAIAAAGRRLVDFHVADNDRRPPGQGMIDWPRVFGELQRIGYEECLTVEFVLPGDVSDSEFSCETQAAAAFLRSAAGSGCRGLPR